MNGTLVFYFIFDYFKLKKKAKCIRGEATNAEVKDDNSLGKATKYGF